MLIINTMKTLITFPHTHIGAFNRSYKAKIAKKEAILKIYDNKRAASFSRKFDKNHHKIVKKASETKITPNLLHLNESLIIHEYLKNTPINRKNFLKSNILSLFKKTLENFHATKIEKTLSLYAQIINYQSVLKNKGLFKQVIDNAENIKKYINKGKILEIGAGGGYFLNEARKEGFGVYGLEFNKTQAKFIKDELNIPCERVALNNKTFNNEKFDVIYHCDVISHFYDPIAEFKKMKEKLNENGFVIFETGNLGDVSIPYFRYITKFQYPGS